MVDILDIDDENAMGLSHKAVNNMAAREWHGALPVLDVLTCIAIRLILLPENHKQLEASCVGSAKKLRIITRNRIGKALTCNVPSSTDVHFRIGYEALWYRETHITGWTWKFLVMRVAGLLVRLDSGNRLMAVSKNRGKTSRARAVWLRGKVEVSQWCSRPVEIRRRLTRKWQQSGWNDISSSQGAMRLGTVGSEEVLVIAE